MYSVYIFEYGFICSFILFFFINQNTTLYILLSIYDKKGPSCQFYILVLLFQGCKHDIFTLNPFEYSYQMYQDYNLIRQTHVSWAKNWKFIAVICCFVIGVSWTLFEIQISLKKRPLKFQGEGVYLFFSKKLFWSPIWWGKQYSGLFKFKT